MTPIYKVGMKHTERVLHDFIRFNNRVRHPMVKVHLTVLGIGFLVLAYLLRERMSAMLVAGGIAVMLLVVLIFRQKIAFIKLSAEDEEYENQSETEFDFGHNEMMAVNSTWSEAVHIKYGEINMLYEDKDNYYICRENEELYLLPLDSFKMGDPEQFKEFMTDKTKKQWVNTKLPLKERIRRMNEARRISEQLHDEKVKQNKKKK